MRFAPSPTGRFHVGNLRTTWISREWARALGLPWVVRFEDIDQPRVLAGAMDQQLADMAALGCVPDRVLVQSALRSRHWRVFLKAREEGAVYPCFCSRKDIQEGLQRLASAPHREGDEPVYDGRCRGLDVAPHVKTPTIAWRFRMPEDESGVRDFVIARTSPISGLEAVPSEESFVPAYNWACAIDDLDGGYELLVRAWDLAHVVTQQRAIQGWLAPGLGLPAVFHTSLVTRDSGERLEKRTLGVTLGELAAVGWSVERLIESFRESFSLNPSSFQPGRIWGEDRRTVTVSELGLPPA